MTLPTVESEVFSAVLFEVIETGKNKNLVMGPEEVRNQERLCWRGPAAIYCHAVLSGIRGIHRQTAR
jgi:hypothetical protein